MTAASLRRLNEIESQLDAPDLTDDRHHELAAEWVRIMKAIATTLSPAHRSALLVDIDKTAASLRSNPPSTKAARSAASSTERTAMTGASPFEPAGHAVIDQRGHVLDDLGPGAPNAKAAAAIRTKEYLKAFGVYLRKGTSGLQGAEVKVLQEGVDEQGGFLVPADIAARIIARSATPTRIAGMVTRLPTSRDRLVVPKVNYSTDDIYSTGARVTWTGEVPSSSTQHRATEPSFGAVAVNVYTAMMSMTATLDMVEDAAFPFLSWLSDRFAETYRLLLDEQILTGSGIGRPAGILLNPGGTDQPAVVNSGGASTLTADGLQDLAWSVPEQYDENAAFVLNKTNTGAAIAKLKDADNRYLWASFDQSGLVLPARSRPLMGYPTAFSGFMPNVAADAYPVIFGDLSGYFLVERVGMSIQVLRERHAEDNQIGLLGRVRFGGLVAEPWKLKIQKVAA